MQFSVESVLFKIENKNLMCCWRWQGQLLQGRPDAQVWLQSRVRLKRQVRSVRKRERKIFEQQSNLFSITEMS